MIMIISGQSFRNAVNEIRPIWNGVLKNPDDSAVFTLDAKEEVISRYQPIFLPENVGSISEEDFRSFLLFSNNHHWKGLHRLGGYITRDMDLLREALSILVDETRPIEDRLEQVLPNSGPMVSHLNRAVLTPILMVTYPDRYGVLNNITEGGFRSLGIWPQFERGSSFAQRYVEVNDILLRLSEELGCDLWTLDAIWWRVPSFSEQEEGLEIAGSEGIELEDGEVLQRFGLERYLQQFLFDNWERVSQLSEWCLYEVDGEIAGFEFNTGEVGRIDLLARHKTDPKWLVIELKRNQGADQTVGQVLRYMGWVRKELANEEDQVRGMIICWAVDPGLRYAISMTRHIALMEYEVDFRLRIPENI
jgi:hypothetical protein